MFDDRWYTINRRLYFYQKDIVGPKSRPHRPGDEILYLRPIDSNRSVPLPEVIDVPWRNFWPAALLRSMLGGKTMLSSVSIVFIVGIDPLLCIYIYNMYSIWIVAMFWIVDDIYPVVI